MRNFNHLYYFHIVAKLGGVTAAAKQLNTSQSSLSTQLKTFESQIGHELFKRDGRKIVLTKAGHSIFNFSRRMFDVASELDAFLAKADHRGRSSFSIGVSPDIERPFVTDAVSRMMHFLSTDHRPLLTQVSYPHEKLVAKLELSELDTVISSQPIHSQNIKTFAEIKLPVKAVAKSTLGRTVSSILEDPLVGLVIPSQDMRLRWETDDYLIKRKIRKTIAFESNVIGALLRATIDGLGVAFLPEAYLEHELKNQETKKGALVISREPLWNHRIYLSAKNRVATDEIRLMLSTLAEELTP